MKCFVFLEKVIKRIHAMVDISDLVLMSLFFRNVDNFLIENVVA